MSWPNIQVRSHRAFGARARFAGALAAIGLAALCLGGCGGIRPLYGPTASGATTQQLMAAVQVTPIPGRVGQRVRNELIFANTGGGEAAPQKYKLNIILRESLTKQLVQVTGQPTSETYVLRAQFKLVDIASGKVLLSGNSIAQAAYDRFNNTFSNVRAEYDAQNRAATQLAEAIKTRIAAYFATQA